MVQASVTPRPPVRGPGTQGEWPRVLREGGRVQGGQLHHHELQLPVLDLTEHHKLGLVRVIVIYPP